MQYRKTSNEMGDGSFLVTISSLETVQSHLNLTALKTAKLYGVLVLSTIGLKYFFFLNRKSAPDMLNTEISNTLKLLSKLSGTKDLTLRYQILIFNVKLFANAAAKAMPTPGVVQ